MEKRISKKNCPDIERKKTITNIKSKIFSILRKPAEESHNNVLNHFKSKENILESNREQVPVFTKYKNEELNLNTDDNNKIKKESIFNIFTYTFKNLIYNVDNLPNIPLFDENDFNFDKKEIFEFINMINIANYYASKIKYLIISCNTNNEIFYKYMNLYNSYLNIR